MILPVEILAMIVCFAAMVTMTLTSANNAQDSIDEEGSMDIISYTKK